MSSPDPLPVAVKTYLRPAFELAYRLTADLAAATTAAADALIRAAASDAPRGERTLLAVFREVVAACSSLDRSPPALREWDLSQDPVELRDAVRKAIPGLPLQSRAALVLREAFELGDEEIGRALGIEAAAVAGLIDTARIRLACPGVWRRSAEARPQRSRSSALSTAAGSICARVQASHHAQGGMDEAEAAAHRQACADCRQHFEWVQKACALTRLATPPALPDSFWDVRLSELEKAWRDSRPAAAERAGLWLPWLLILVAAVLALIVWWWPEPAADPHSRPPAAETTSPAIVDSTETIEAAAPVRVEEPPAREVEPPVESPPVQIESALPARPHATPEARVLPVEPPPTNAPSAEELHILLQAYPEVAVGASELRPLTEERD